MYNKQEIALEDALVYGYKMKLGVILTVIVPKLKFSKSKYQAEITAIKNRIRNARKATQKVQEYKLIWDCKQSLRQLVKRKNCRILAFLLSSSILQVTHVCY